MSRIRTISLAVLLSALAPLPSGAENTLSQVFAECAGRYSAEREHAWLMGNADAEELEDRRLTFLSLLDATLPAGDARAALSYRIEVKMAHSSLLTLATFGVDQARATRARSLAEHHLVACQQLLLDS